ncbi:MAG: hypothetical protein E7299_07115 [Lachnospiraceae bacterium]|nr:hypothetical protein [Lachnospiraceae bacterium]
MKRWKVMALALFSAFCIVACGKETPQEDVTSISVGNDGTIDYKIVENFGTEYSISDFEAMLQEDVTQYNQGLAEGAIEIAGVSQNEKGNIVVEMKFPSAADFNGFCNINTMEEILFFYGTIEEAYKAGHSLDVILHGRENDTEILKKNDILNLGESKILIYDARLNHDGTTQTPANMRINVSGQISHVSNGVVIVDKNTVDISAIDGLYYIILND